MGLGEHDLRELDDQQCLMILGTYTHDVKRGYNHEKRSDYAPETIRGYLKSAHGYLQALLARDIPTCRGQKVKDTLESGVLDTACMSSVRDHALPCVTTDDSIEQE